jgi:ubiquinone/menaquinone biosynthesis C-methylase UbiE
VSPFDQDYPVADGIVRALAARPKLPLAQTSNFWPPVARLYEPLWRQRSLGLITGGQLTTEQELAAMLRAVAPQPGERLLDAACSAGLYARTLKAQAPEAEVHALDLSLPFLQQAARYARAEQLALTLVEADVSRLPYRAAVFDAVTCGGSLNEFLKLPQAFSELARVLKPGGRLWLMYVAPSRSALGQMLQKVLKGSGLRFIDPASLQQQAEMLGLHPRWQQQHGVIRLEHYDKRP